jgi:hypothetical protein
MKEEEVIKLSITSVNYSRLVNLGDYENEKLGASAVVPEGYDPEKIVALLKTWVNNLVVGQQQARDLAQEYRENKWELERVHRLQEQMARDYQFALEVLRGHNIDTTGYNPPSFLTKAYKLAESQPPKAERYDTTENIENAINIEEGTNLTAVFDG